MSGIKGDDMTIEEMKQRKKELGYSNKELASRAGVPETTIQKIFSGKTAAPRRDTILKLEQTLRRPTPDALTEIRVSLPDIEKLPVPTRGLVREPEVPYGIPGKKQGDYTLEDYLALPEERRVELIDGVFYDMAAPTTVHQAIGGYIHKILLDHVLAHGGPCKPFMSPVDVQLDRDDRTIVQPDVLVVCDHGKYKKGRVYGAPDFIAEVLSPSTRRKDVTLKLVKYTNAGVREYWMIDPDKQKLVVYELQKAEFPTVYGFDDTVPVRIWNGECQVDFAKIRDFIADLYD